MLTVVICALTIIVFAYLFFEVQKEKRRNRIMQAFTAGIIKSMSDYISSTDMPDISSAADIAKAFNRDCSEKK